jgi:uncharacterized protein YcfL
MKRLILLLLALFLVGCGNDDNNPTVPQLVNAECRDSNPDCDIMPLAVGNSWTYENIYYDSLGVELNRDTTYYSVTKDSVIDSET